MGPAWTETLRQTTALGGKFASSTPFSFCMPLKWTYLQMSFRSPYMISVKLAMTTVPRLLKSTQKERAVPNLALQRGTGFRYIFTSYELYRIINGASIPVSSEWMFRAQAPVRRAMDTLLLHIFLWCHFHSDDQLSYPQFSLGVQEKKARFLGTVFRAVGFAW